MLEASFAKIGVTTIKTNKKKRLHWVKDIRCISFISTQHIQFKFFSNCVFKVGTSKVIQQGVVITKRISLIVSAYVKIAN